MNEEAVEKRIARDVPLSRYTTYRLGGPAEYFFEALTADDLKAALLYARSRGLRHILLGGGSNVLVADAGVKGLVIRNLCASLHFSDTGVTAQSGVTLSMLLKEGQRRGLGGLEHLAGIPGTLGGALYGNAGAYGKSIADSVEHVIIVTGDGKEKKVHADYLDFHYRRSRLKETGDIVLSAALSLKKARGEDIEKEMERIIGERREKHPCAAGSCGCFFKNVESGTPGSRPVSAGKLLEEAGARNICVGDACVSNRHANFLINRGNATAGDIRALADLLKRKVYQRFAVELEEEVQFIGDF